MAPAGTLTGGRRAVGASDASPSSSGAARATGGIDASPNKTTSGGSGRGAARRFGGGLTLTGDGVCGGDGMDRGGASRGSKKVAVQHASSASPSAVQRGSGRDRVVSTKS